MLSLKGDLVDRRNTEELRRITRSRVTLTKNVLKTDET